MNTQYDLIVIGSGAAGIMGALRAAKDGKKVLLLERLPKIAAKLKATGGGRCNLTNTLVQDDFMKKFGKQGRFMSEALASLSSKDLCEFFEQIGVETHAPDGYRIFPITHNSGTIIAALQAHMEYLGVSLLCNIAVKSIKLDVDKNFLVKSDLHTFSSKAVLIATGGLGYPVLGALGDGYKFASSFGHTIKELSPAMMPLKVSESWVSKLRAHTIAKVCMRVDLPKMQKIQATGDLIFTKNGIRGPVVLDFAREITPLLKKYKIVPIVVNLTKGMHQEQIRSYLKDAAIEKRDACIVDLLQPLLPLEVCSTLCGLVNIDEQSTYGKLSGQQRDALIKILAWTPLRVIGHDGYEKAMITRGGVSLKEVDPKSMQSRLVSGLYFAGEVLDLDGPCGGYNLQWSFSSGYLAGGLKP